MSALNGHAITLTPILDNRTDPISPVLLSFAVDVGLTSTSQMKPLAGGALDAIVQKHRIKEEQVLAPEGLSPTEKKKAKEVLLIALPPE